MAVSRGDDVNGDGHDDILVGNSSDNEGGEGAGAVYLVRGGPGM